MQGTPEKWPFRFEWYTYKLIIILRRLEVFKVQQYSYNPVSSHLEILRILCLRRPVARQEVLLPPPKCLIIETGRSLGQSVH